jgi:hypothetical protein
MRVARYLRCFGDVEGAKGESRETRSLNHDKIPLSVATDDFVKFHDLELYQAGPDFKRISYPPYKVLTTKEEGRVMFLEQVFKDKGFSKPSDVISASVLLCWQKATSSCRLLVLIHRSSFELKRTTAGSWVY